MCTKINSFKGLKRIFFGPEILSNCCFSVTFLKEKILCWVFYWIIPFFFIKSVCSPWCIYSEHQSFAYYLWKCPLPICQVLFQSCTFYHNYFKKYNASHQSFSFKLELFLYLKERHSHIQPHFYRHKFVLRLQIICTTTSSFSRRMSKWGSFAFQWCPKTMSTVHMPKNDARPSSTCKGIAWRYSLYPFVQEIPFKGVDKDRNWASIASKKVMDVWVSLQTCQLLPLFWSQWVRL